MIVSKHARICFHSKASHRLKLWCIGTRLAITLRGDESYEDMSPLKSADATMLLINLPRHDEKVSRVHASRR